MRCQVLTFGIDGPCVCGARLEGQCHVVKQGEQVWDLRCPACCVVCHPKVAPFVGEAVTISGEQERLF